MKSQKNKQKPIIYIDIDGVLLANEYNLAEGAEEFIKYIADNFKVKWLTTHCMSGNTSWAINYVNRASSNDLEPYLKQFVGTTWEENKTEAIDFSKHFLWYDDDLFHQENKDLIKHGKTNCFHKINLSENPYQIQDELDWLKTNV